MTSADGSTTFCSFITKSTGKCGIWTPDGSKRCKNHKLNIKKIINKKSDSKIFRRSKFREERDK
jgi:hypothetical protein